MERQRNPLLAWEAEIAGQGGGLFRWSVRCQSAAWWGLGTHFDLQGELKLARQLVLTTDSAESSAVGGGGYARISSRTESALAEVMAGILKVDDVPVGSHFFDDLGADSMVMAQFCARVRKRGDLPSVSMKDIYQHPTIKDLAATFAERALPTASPHESALAEVMAGILKVDDVPVGSHFFDDLGADSMVMAQFCARVRKRADLPSVSMKDIYQHPTIKDLAATFAERALPTASPHESALAEVMAGILKVDDVPVGSHFFDDLGADSMVMAQFCARVRKRADLPSVSMKDIYQHPTIKDLAAAFTESAPAPAPLPETVPARDLPEPTNSETAAQTTTEAAPRASTGQYFLCGTLQLLMFLGYTTAFVAILSRGYLWVAAGAGLLDIYLRSLAFGGGMFLGLSVLPIVTKWVLIGRWKPQQIQIWSLGYFRFWLVKTLIRANPLALLVLGSPLYVLYLRALGARVGKRVTILTRAIPVCTDLLTIGDGTVIRKSAFLSCYRAHAGRIEIGPVTLGRDVVISESTVLDIETSMGDGAQLGHASSLHSGQAVPAGERWHGSPAQRTEIDYQWVQPTDCGTLRRVLYPLTQILIAVLVSLPLVIAGAVLLVQNVPQIPALLDGPHLSPAGSSFYLEAAVASSLLMVAGLVVGLLFVASVPRVLNLLIKPGKVYPLYGIHYFVHSAVARMTNIRAFMYLFGDSSYIVHYLRYLGYQLKNVEQTGSNFGVMVVHDNPYLSSVGSGTVVADGLSINNADFSSTSFRVSQTTIGPHNFLGNYVTYPSQGRTGDNCLLGTKVMVPVDGSVRTGVGLLGSPSFEIPRSVLRDTNLAPKSRDELRRKLARKNKHNLATIALVLLVQWVNLYVLTMLAMVVTDIYRLFGGVALAAPLVVSLLFTMAYTTFVERAAGGFRPLRPRYCSIYDPYFWWHERYWKFAVSPFDRMLVGTPFKNIMSRLHGVRIGKLVFDDGCAIPERTLVTIGDHCALNLASMVQAHSQEDGAFKSDHITVGSGCTVGVGALVHYGVTMGDGAVLAADSFLMKGEQVPPHAHWGGNPAEEMPDRISELMISSRATPTTAAPEEPWTWDLTAAMVASPPAGSNGHVSPYPRWDADPAHSTRVITSGLMINGRAEPRSSTQAWSWDLRAEDRQDNGSDVMVRSRPTRDSSPAEPWSWW